MNMKEKKCTKKEENEEQSEFCERERVSQFVLS